MVNKLIVRLDKFRPIWYLSISNVWAARRLWPRSKLFEACPPRAELTMAITCLRPVLSVTGSTATIVLWSLAEAFWFLQKPTHDLRVFKTSFLNWNYKSLQCAASYLRVRVVGAQSEFLCMTLPLIARIAVFISRFWYTLLPRCRSICNIFFIAWLSIMVVVKGYQVSTMRLNYQQA